MNIFKVTGVCVLCQVAGPVIASAGSAPACDPATADCVNAATATEPASLPLLAIGLATLALAMVVSRNRRS